MIVIGVDPGLDTGYAVIRDGILTYAQLGCNPFGTDPAAKVYIECPRIYPTGTPNPNDLIKLAVMVGEYKAGFEFHNCKVVLIAPSDWKGQLPKAVTEKRVRARFPDVDRWLVGVPKSKQHNVLDAIGIACYGYDREARK